MLYDWPKASTFMLKIPKNKIYEHSEVSVALRGFFVHEVAKIIWSHKLSPETINLVAGKVVNEIQIFRLIQKTDSLNEDVLYAIDKAIPFPILFELYYNDRIKLMAACKRPNELNTRSWVVGDYYAGEWFSKDAPRTTLPVALNLGVLYEQLLIPLVLQQTKQLIVRNKTQLKLIAESESVFSPISLEEIIAHSEAVKSQVCKVGQIQSQLKRERQFSKSVIINAELREAKKQLELLLVTSQSRSVTSN